MNQAVADLAEEGEGNVFDSLGRAWDTTRESLNLRQRVAVIKARATEVIEHLIQLSVVFVLQTGILPLAFLWLLVQVMKRAFGFYRHRREN